MSCNNEKCGLAAVTGVVNITSDRRCVRALTDVRDVKREPVEESVADQFGKQQTERELYHPLQDMTQTQWRQTNGEHFVFSVGNEMPFSC